MCCDSDTGVPTAYINWGPSSQASKPTGGLNGPTAFQGLATAGVPLEVLLPSYSFSPL